MVVTSQIQIKGVAAINFANIAGNYKMGEECQVLFLSLLLLSSLSVASTYGVAFAADSLVLKQSLTQQQGIRILADCNAHDPFTCYFNSLIIPVPNPPCQSVPSWALGGGQICVTSLTCSQFGLKSFPSTYQPPRSVGLAILDLDFSCSGKWVWGNWNGDLGAVVTNASASALIALDKSLTSDLPLSASFTSCGTKIQSAKVSFTGGSSWTNKIFTEILNLLSSAVSDA